MTEIALIGNPNSGKTSLFNLLTGTSQRVGNWPGVTVERKSGNVKKLKEISVQDLPGIYSMSPYSPEEKVARDYLLSNHADSILNVVDATNLERNLYLTTQLIETGIPVTIALNMSDVLKNQGKSINSDKLAYQMGVPVVATSALKNTGVDKAVKKPVKQLRAVLIVFNTQLTMPNLKQRLPKLLRFSVRQYQNVLAVFMPSNYLSATVWLKRN